MCPKALKEKEKRYDFSHARRMPSGGDDAAASLRSGGTCNRVNRHDVKSRFNVNSVLSNTVTVKNRLNVVTVLTVMAVKPF